MSGTIPDIFDKMPDLTHIQISNNANVAGSVPSSVSNLTKLVSLYLQHSKIT